MGALLSNLGRASTFAAAIIQLIAFTFAGKEVLTVDAPWLNGWLRAGIAVYFFTSAAFPFFPLYGPVARVLGMSVIRSLHTRASGYVLAGMLICIGALITWSVVGLIAAIAAFSFAWMYWWIGRMMGPSLPARIQTAGASPDELGTPAAGRRAAAGERRTR